MELQRVRPAADGAEGEGPGPGPGPWEAQRVVVERPRRVAAGSPGWRLALPRASLAQPYGPAFTVTRAAAALAAVPAWLLPKPRFLLNFCRFTAKGLAWTAGATSRS